VICCSSVVYYLSVTSARWFITSPCFPEGFLLAPLARWLSPPYCAGGLFFPPPGGLFLLLQLVNLTLLLPGDLFLPYCQVVGLFLPPTARWVAYFFLPLRGVWLFPSSHCQVAYSSFCSWLIGPCYCLMTYSFPTARWSAYSFLSLPGRWLIPSSYCQVVG
jgi:hypothetical protein